MNRTDYRALRRFVLTSEFYAWHGRYHRQSAISQCVVLLVFDGMHARHAERTWSEVYREAEDDIRRQIAIDVTRRISQ